MRIHLAVFSLAVLFCFSAPAATYHVNATSGNDAGNGLTPATAVRTITRGLALASSGDVVLVAAGTYNAALGEVFPIAMKSGVRLRGEAGAESTIVSAGATTRVMNLSGGPGTIIEGLTFRDGSYQATSYVTTEGGGAIRITGGDRSTIRRCIFRNNQTLGYSPPASEVPQDGGYAQGGAIYSVDSEPVIANNIFIDNLARGGNATGSLIGPGAMGGVARGGAIFTNAPTDALIVNNTFHSNRAIGGQPAGSGYPGVASGGAVATFSAAVVNNIFAFNRAEYGGGSTPATTPGAVTGFEDAIQNNLFWSNSPSDGIPGEFAVTGLDPMFIDPPADLDLQLFSPAIGRASSLLAPIHDFDGYSRPTPAALGAFEPVDLRTRNAGDFDGDGYADVVTRNIQTGDITVRFMQGATVVASSFVASALDYIIAGVGDFNRDGFSDLLLRDHAGNIGMWLMNGAAIVGGGLVASMGDYTVAGIADFSGDGRSDILLRDSVGDLGMWVMNGTNIVAGGFVGTPGVYRIAAFGDFDDDKRADIVLVHPIGKVGLWRMNGPTILSGHLVGSADGYTVHGAADFSGDGVPDIVLRGTGGYIGLWIMDGHTITEGIQVGYASGLITRSLGSFAGRDTADILFQDFFGGAGMWLMRDTAINSGAPAALPGLDHEYY